MRLPSVLLFGSVSDMEDSCFRLSRFHWSAAAGGGGGGGIRGV